MFKLYLIDGEVSELRHYNAKSIKYSMMINGTFCIFDAQGDEVLPIRDRDRLVAVVISKKNEVNKIMDFKNLNLGIYDRTNSAVARFWLGIPKIILLFIALVFFVGGFAMLPSRDFWYGVICLFIGTLPFVLYLYFRGMTEAMKKSRKMINEYLESHNL